ncbi:sugar ABC transporter ATP-binding protein [uncultured Sphaerochaeta sp.]|uniref:sugar ABC transporter ATP-binding protein n=1 Tax=uncultured Sphaerochaeta sp. TaxID=886478 RepID=UPI002A0A1903|nr:sugar ABC transporter ATP-binding protein [uncultured Sphaerochaeta sp.]
MAEYILEMNNISKIFPGVKALDDVSFKLKPGSVHALMGENGAGKSTLMKILVGKYVPDRGEIIYQGRKIQNYFPGEAISMGITMVYQELSYVPQLSIAENMFLGRELVHKFVINKKEMELATEKYLSKVGVHLDPNLCMKDLSVSERQMVEIAKCVSCNAKVVVLDEPTSAITDNEVRELFNAIGTLKARGVSVIYITHKMDEVQEISDEVTVLRDGKLIHVFETSEIQKDIIIKCMVGHELNQMFPIRKADIGQEILQVKDLCREGKFQHINFSLRKGEILGFSGLMGAGRTEIMRAIYGLDKFDSGEIFLDGKRTEIKSPSDAIRNKIGLVNEDRKGMGLVLTLSIKKNLTLSNLDKYFHSMVINTKRENQLAEKMIDALKIKTPSMDQLTINLSGGNQQKIVLGRLLLDESEILIMDEPTRGIDIGAKAEIYKLICDLAEHGKSIILVSSEMPELIGLADRIIVLHEGRITGELERKEFSQEKIMELAIA